MPAIHHIEAIDSSMSIERFNQDFDRWNTNKIKNTTALDFFKNREREENKEG